MTIPGDVLRRADRLARALDRSRSWVLAEGVRRLEEPRVGRAGADIAAPGGAAADASAELDESRRRQLADDLRLSVEERVLAAERTARESPAPSFGRLFVSFQRPEDWFEWKRLEAAGRL